MILQPTADIFNPARDMDIVFTGDRVEQLAYQSYEISIPTAMEEEIREMIMERTGREVDIEIGRIKVKVRNGNRETV